MEFTNNLLALSRAEGGVDHETLEDAVKMIAPFAPHIGEELWRELGHDSSVFHAPWPTFDEEANFSNLAEIPLGMRDTDDGAHTIEITADLESFEILYSVETALHPL